MEQDTIAAEVVEESKVEEVKEEVNTEVKEEPKKESSLPNLEELLK